MKILFKLINISLLRCEMKKFNCNPVNIKWSYQSAVNGKISFGMWQIGLYFEDFVNSIWFRKMFETVCVKRKSTTKRDWKVKRLCTDFNLQTYSFQYDTEIDI